MRFTTILTSLMMSLLITHAEAEDVASLSADAIMLKHAQHQKLDSEVELVTIVTVERDGETKRHSILFLTQKNEDGGHDYLVRVISPEKFSGVGLLSKEEADGEINRYFYLPALGQVKRIKGEGGGQTNFLGSNFSYDDLLKENPKRYKYERLEDEKVDGVPCFVLRATTQASEDDEESGYRFRDIYLDHKDFNIYQIQFYGYEHDRPLKTLTASDYNSVRVDGPTMRPLRAMMRNHENGTISVLSVMRSRFNEKLDPEIFTTKGLSSWSKEQKQKILSNFASK